MAPPRWQARRAHGIRHTAPTSQSPAPADPGGTYMTGEDVYHQLQSAARSVAAKRGVPAPTEEYLIRHALESFLDRLNRTSHARDFVLKGGILLGAYGVRRPTKDADSNAIGAEASPEHLANVV